MLLALRNNQVVNISALPELLALGALALQWSGGALNEKYTSIYISIYRHIYVYVSIFSQRDRRFKTYRASSLLLEDLERVCSVHR